MLCNFVTYAITYISSRQYIDLRQDIWDPHLNVILCPIQITALASLLLLQELKDLTQSRQTIKCANVKEVQKLKLSLNFYLYRDIKNKTGIKIIHLESLGA